MQVKVKNNLFIYCFVRIFFKKFKDILRLLLIFEFFIKSKIWDIIKLLL